MKHRLLTGLLVGLSLCTASWAQTLRPAAFPGEGQNQVRLELNQPAALAASSDVKTSARGVRPATTKTEAELLSNPVAVGLVNPRPFIFLSTIWEGQRLFESNVGVELRHSVDGRKWSDWAETEFDHHLGDDATNRTTKMVQLETTVRFVQFRAHLNSSVSEPQVERVVLNFYSPGDTPAGMGVPTEVAEEVQQELGRAAAVCPKPPVVSRASWGARAPTAQNGPTTITHLVVHHEEGSNTSSDWAARVRGIQNLHMSNDPRFRFSDIGYAFLIAPTGTIYEGRAGGEDTQGAHFCPGGNRNAMGICMLGSYTSASPTAAARASLVRLLAWKASKNNINPLGKSTHYMAGNINNICGHRDNNRCSTCPGDQLYRELGGIRTSVNNAVSNCNGTPPPPPPTGDTQDPDTDITAASTTVSADFTANFADTDNVGVVERFYQVLESANGEEWRANRGNGFFNDNFNAAPINSEWTARTGSWAVNADERLQQSNTTLTNTNISTALSQGSGQTYLYNFAAKLNSTSGSRRYGLHIMASDVAAQERANSYLIWFTADDQKVRIIETVNNVLNERAVANRALPAGAWADYKVTYNSSNGEIRVYVNDALVVNWTDSSPLTSGAGISLRTNEANVEFDNVKVYKSRPTSRVITVGTASNKDLRRASPNASTPAGKIKSLVRDAANNWSSAGNLDLVVNLPATVAAQPVRRPAAFPNPLVSGATLRYSVPKAGAIRVSLYDDRGRRLAVLHDGEQAAGEYTLDMPQLKPLSAGTYHVRIEGAGETESLTLRKE